MKKFYETPSVEVVEMEIGSPVMDGTVNGPEDEEIG